MSKKLRDANYAEVATEVSAFLTEKYGGNASSADVLEGLWLAMQMVGGPEAAARTISYCSVKVD